MRKNTLLKLVLVLAGWVVMADSIVVPIVPNIINTYPDISSFILNFIITGTYLVAIPGSLITGRLAQSFSKKSLLVFAYVIFIISGVGLANTDQLSLVVFYRIMMGICYGFVGPICISFMATLFEDEKERGATIGWFFAFTSIAGMGFATSSGYIALVNWKYAFYLTLIAVPVLVLILIYIPRTEPEGKASMESKGQNEKEISFPYTRIGILSLSAFAYTSLFMILFVFIAVYVQEQRLGDASHGGIMSSMQLFGSLISCSFFTFFYNLFKRTTPVVFYLLASICIFTLSLDVNLWIVGIACLVCGWCYGLAVSYFMLKSTNVPDRYYTMSVAIITSCIMFSSYIAPQLLDSYKSVFRTQTVRGALFYIAITLTICTFISMIHFFVICRNKKELKLNPAES